MTRNLTPKHTVAGLGLALLATLTAACGGSSGSGRSNEAKDSIEASTSIEAEAGIDDGIAACDLLEDDEVAQLLGGDVVHGYGGGLGESSCEWHIDASDPLGPSGQVLLHIGQRGTAPGGRIEGESDYGPTTPMEGVGEGARLSGGSIQVLEFPAGDRACQLQVVLPGAFDDRERVTAVALPLAAEVRERLG